MKHPIPETTLEKARSLHGMKYEYLARVKKPVGHSGEFFFLHIRCGLHGDFWQREASHLKGAGCKHCSTEAATARMSMSLSDFLAKVKEENLENFLYLKLYRQEADYGENSSVKTKAMVTAKCRNGHILEALAGNHVLKTLSCLKCKGHRLELSDYVIHEGLSDPRLESNGRRRVVTADCAIHGRVALLDGKPMMCGKCARAAVGSKLKHNISDVVARVEESETNLVLDESTYKSVAERALFTCANGHSTWKKVSEVVSTKKGCIFCSHRVSQQNNEIADYIRSLGLEVLQEHILEGRKSVDVFVPEKNLAIDFHGNIWHSERFNPNNRKHLDRLELTRKRGWTYIQIFSDEWRTRKPQILSRIRHLLGWGVRKVAARKCDIRSVEKEEANIFVDKFHLQGSAKNYSKAFGLYEGEELVSVMQVGANVSVRKHRDVNTLELIRYCTSASVQGGLSKLLAHLRVTYHGMTLVTYSDDRMFDGKSYEMSGFTKLYSSAPDYSYIAPDDDTRIHKSNLQKSRIAAKHGIAVEGFTERELTSKLGLYRLYDAGKTKWFMEL